ERAHQHADAAGIDHGDFAYVNDDPRVPGAQMFFQNVAKRVHGLADLEVAPKLYHLHIRLLADVNVQRLPPAHTAMTQPETPRWRCNSASRRAGYFVDTAIQLC